MAASEEAYGAGHPATYDATDETAPNYDPSRAAEARKAQARREGRHVAGLSGIGFGEDQQGFPVEVQPDPEAQDHGPDN